MPHHFSVEEQTVPLEAGELQFVVDPSNTAICHLIIPYADGKKARLSFNRNGMFIGVSPVEQEKPAEEDKPEAETHATRKRDRHSVE